VNCSLCHPEICVGPTDLQMLKPGLEIEIHSAGSAARSWQRGEHLSAHLAGWSGIMRLNPSASPKRAVGQCIVELARAQHKNLLRAGGMSANLDREQSFQP
jgi:hypothetical protein